MTGQFVPLVALVCLGAACDRLAGPDSHPTETTDGGETGQEHDGGGPRAALDLAVDWTAVQTAADLADTPVLKVSWTRTTCSAAHDPSHQGRGVFGAVTSFDFLSLRGPPPGATEVVLGAFTVLEDEGQDGEPDFPLQCELEMARTLIGIDPELFVLFVPRGAQDLPSVVGGSLVEGYNLVRLSCEPTPRLALAVGDEASVRLLPMTTSWDLCASVLPQAGECPCD